MTVSILLDRTVLRKPREYADTRVSFEKIESPSVSGVKPVKIRRSAGLSEFASRCRG